MGVLKCDRKNCENIMCRYYSVVHGYLCEDCFEELVSSGYKTDVTNFMSDYRKIDKVDARIVFIQIFTDRYKEREA